MLAQVSGRKWKQAVVPGLYSSNLGRNCQEANVTCAMGSTCPWCCCVLLHSETGTRLTAPPLPSFLSVRKRRHNCPMQTPTKTHTASEKPALTPGSLLHVLALLNSLVSSISPFIHKRNRNVKAIIQKKMLLKWRDTNKDSNCAVAIA